MDNRIEKTIKALEQNNMQVFYVKDKAAVCETVKTLLFKGCTITAGGSVSVKESGVWDIIKSPDYRFSDRTDPALTEEERLEVFKTAVGCDFFFCSSNAVTENGELINVDGTANRISSVCFGPKSVIMIVGVNKIVPDVNAGLLRIKKISAPLNTERLKIDAPCRKLGHCISLENKPCPDMTDGCKTDARICCDYLISARQRVKNRIKIILCEENLGY